MWILVGQKGESKARPNTESEVCFLRVQKRLDLLPLAKPAFIRVLWLVSLGRIPSSPLTWLHFSNVVCASVLDDYLCDSSTQRLKPEL